MTTYTAAGYIVADNEGTIHGFGATADLAWADMRQTMAYANIALLTDDDDSSDQDGSWTRESGMRLHPATQGLLDLVMSHGGACSWTSVAGVACTVDEEG